MWGSISSSWALTEIRKKRMSNAVEGRSLFMVDLLEDALEYQNIKC